MGKDKNRNTNTMPMMLKNCHNHTIPLSILDELAARFLVNVPEEEKHDLTRICFQLELSHWFYVDFYVPNNPNLAKGTIMEFATHMFNHIDYLRKHVKDIENIVQNWMIYKKSVPVNGAVLLNKRMNKILMVKSFGTKPTWAFPKGKINQGEEKHACAVREVYEETGYDITALIDKDLYVEKVVNRQTVRLYLVAGAEEEFPFRARTRGEISEVRWWEVTSLPSSRADKLGARQRLGMSVNMFYNATPFIKDIRDWVTNLCVKKASWAVLETEAVRSDEGRNLIEGNYDEIVTLSKPFYPECWKNFKFRFEEIENSLFSS